MIINCHFCDKKLERDAYRIKRSKNHYCDVECRYKAQHNMPNLASRFGKYSIKGNVGPNKGKRWSDEAKKQMSIGHKIKHIEPKLKFSASGENNPTWKGDMVGYGGLHDWVKAHKGKPTTCEHCGLTSTNLEWANKSHEYKRDLNDWLRLCRPCHRKYDGKIEIERYI